MGRCLLLFALVGCAPHATTGPAWPKDRTTATAGGESLAPRESRQIASVIEKSADEPKPAAAPVTAATVTPVVDAAGPVVAPVMSQSIEETITSEDIIIEIDD